MQTAAAAAAAAAARLIRRPVWRRGFDTGLVEVVRRSLLSGCLRLLWAWERLLLDWERLVMSPSGGLEAARVFAGLPRGFGLFVFEGAFSSVKRTEVDMLPR